MTSSAVRSFGSGAVRHLLEGFEEMGLDGARLCRDAGIAPRRLGDRDGRVEVPLLCALFAAAEAHSSDALPATPRKPRRLSGACGGVGVFSERRKRSKRRGDIGGIAGVMALPANTGEAR